MYKDLCWHDFFRKDSSIINKPSLLQLFILLQTIKRINITAIFRGTMREDGGCRCDSTHIVNLSIKVKPCFTHTHTHTDSLGLMLRRVGSFSCRLRAKRSLHMISCCHRSPLCHLLLLLSSRSTKTL